MIKTRRNAHEQQGYLQKGACCPQQALMQRFGMSAFVRLRSISGAHVPLALFANRAKPEVLNRAVGVVLATLGIVIPAFNAVG